MRIGEEHETILKLALDSDSDVEDNVWASFEIASPPTEVKCATQKRLD